MSVQIQLRRGTPAEWHAANPILAVGEPGIAQAPGSHELVYKVGDGVTAWRDLPSVPEASAAGMIDELEARLTTTIATEVDRASQPTVLLDIDGTPYFILGPGGIALDADGRPYVTIGA